MSAGCEHALSERPCVTRAWQAHAGELRHFLFRQTGRAEEAEEILSEVFLRVLRQGANFCALENPRAWLFQVARHVVIDRGRALREVLPLPDDLVAPETESLAPVDQLSQCLPRVLAELDAADRLAITLCDLEGRPQQELAEQLGLSLSGAKSRLQRARQRLRARLEGACRVRYDESGAVCGFTPRPPQAEVEAS